MKKISKFTTLAFGLILTLGMSVSLANRGNLNLVNSGPEEVTPLRAAFTPVHAGTEADPYSVEDVVGLGKNIGKNDNRGKFEYVKGVVDSDPNIDSRHPNASFDLKDESSNHVIGTYRVRGLNGKDFTENSCKKGDIVVINGCIGKHDNNLQVAHLNNTNAQLISVTTPVYPLNSITLKSDFDFVYVDKSLQLTVAYDSPLVGADKKGATFASSNDEFASVDANGLVTGHKECDKVIITATSKFDTSLTSSIELSVKKVPYDNQYTWSYNTASNILYNETIQNGNKYINGYKDNTIAFSSTSLYANNYTHLESLVLGTKNGQGSLNLTVCDLDSVITSIELIGAKVSSKDDPHEISCNNINYTIKAQETSESTTVIFYPCSQSATLNTSLRVFFDQIVIQTVKLNNANQLADSYYQTFLQLTQDACGAKNVTKEVWNRCKAAFDNLNVTSNEAATLVKNADVTQEAILRYKGIIEKYGTGICEDYLGKGYEGLTRNAILSLEDNQMIISIVCISILSVSAIVLLVSLKRRKQAK